MSIQCSRTLFENSSSLDKVRGNSATGSFVKFMKVMNSWKLHILLDQEVYWDAIVLIVEVVNW